MSQASPAAYQNEPRPRRGLVEIEIGAELTVRGLPPSVDAQVRDANTFPNPEHKRRERMGLWTGDTDREIQLYRRATDGLVVPRGTFPIVIARCRDAGVRFSVDDRTVCPPPGIELELGGELYDYQRRALDDLLEYGTGVLQAPTGSGKTVVMLGAIPRLATRALILVHTKELFAQTREAVRQWLGVEAGALGAGEWDLQPVSVGMLQTLTRRDLDELADYFGAVLVDEAHHSPARSWARILDQLPAKYRYGFTATAWRKDGLGTLIRRTIGSVSAKVSEEEVQAAGTVVAPEVEVVETEFFFELEGNADWPAMISALAADEDRNDLIVSEVRERLKPGTRALVLSDRVAHVETLAELMADLDPVALTGELSPGDREQGMDAVRNGVPLTIATSQLLGEGVDVSGWNVLVLATPIAGGPRTLQAVGRVTRAAPGKDRAVVVDLVDARVEALKAAYRKRARLYAA